MWYYDQRRGFMIIFDIDNTLIDYNGSERNAITALFGKEYNYNLDESQIDYWSQISKSLFENYLEKKMTFCEQGK